MKHVKYVLTVIILVSMLAVAAPVGARSGVENPTVPNWWTVASPPPPVKAPPPAPVAFLGVNPAAPAGQGIESLSSSYVAFDPSVGGDTGVNPGIPQTFCFRAESFTDDWEYVYNLWLKFPADWTVTNAYVVETPTCTGGGTWGTFSWSFETTPYEINILHPRYQAYTDHCTAHYCIDVVAGGISPFADESWYWDGDGYNYAPHHPCSNDNYTPPSMAGYPCDEAVNPPATIPPCCAEPGVYLLPPTQTAAGCNGVPQEHTLSLYNSTGSTGTFTMTYTVSSVNGTLTGPATVTANDDEVVPFTVTLTPDLCAQPGVDVIGQIDAAGNGYSDSATIAKTVTAEPGDDCPVCDLQGWLEGTVLDGDMQPATTAGQAVESLSGSFVFFDPSVGGDTCYVPGDPQTFCFRAESYSPDWEYVYNVWLKFPTDWTVSNAYVVGTPVCDNGSSWGTFSWSFETSPYEINIAHGRYHVNGGDHCVATYCVDTVPGAHSGNAPVSWYWDGDGYNAAPHHPCSTNVYTPASMSYEPCDEAVNPQAMVTSCCCGAPEPPCTDATVTINPGNVVVGVDPATGHYGPVQLVQGEYTVEASAPGYSVETATVTIVDEMTTTQDFVLWRPVVDVEPLSIRVQSPPSVPVTIPLTIANLGHLPLDWEIVEVPSSRAVEAEPTATAGQYQQTPAQFGVDPFIFSQMEAAADGKADFFIAFHDTADLSGAYAIRDRAERVQWVRNALRTAADRAQARVRAWLDGQGISYRVYCVDNTILVNGNRALLETLRAQFAEISGFHGNHTYSILPVQSLAMGPVQDTEAASPDAIVPWDLTMMSVPQTWDELGVTGAGAIVANVDTGVYYQHEALFPNYLCGDGPHDDCWLDPDGGTTAPNDTYGHGTWTMSQMAADNDAAFQYAVGAAPDAGWIACLGCPGGSCPDTALNACADWLVMTTPNTPNVVDNPWGTWAAACDTWYQGRLQAYRAAGILPVFSAGGMGNSCGTSSSPANNAGAFAVGATTTDDVQAAFSGTGPGICPGEAQFPDIVAPGVTICSATNTGGYDCSLSGTSFASALTAGCAALVASADPSLSGDQVEAVLLAAADDKPNTDCGSPQPDPNYRYGDGRVNCFAAVSAVYDADISWVWAAPVTGTVPPLEAQPVDVIFQCTPDQQGLILTGTLRIDDNDPCAERIDVPIELTCGEPCTPVAEAWFDHVPPMPLVGQGITFTADTAPISATTPVDFAWDFGDGGTASGQTVTHTFAMIGTHPVTLTASNLCSQVVYNDEVDVYVALYLPIVMRNSPSLGPSPGDFRSLKDLGSPSDEAHHRRSA